MTTVKEQKAKDAIQAVFSDRSQTKAQTKAILKSLVEELEVMIDSIVVSDEDY